MTQEEMVSVVNQLCRQVKELHATGRIHSDIKPDNIFLKRNKKDGTILANLGDLDFYKIENGQMVVKGKLRATDAFCAPAFQKYFEIAKNNQKIGTTTHIPADE